MLFCWREILFNLISLGHERSGSAGIWGFNASFAGTLTKHIGILAYIWIYLCLKGVWICTFDFESILTFQKTSFKPWINQSFCYTIKFALMWCDVKWCWMLVECWSFILICFSVVFSYILPNKKNESEYISILNLNLNLKHLNKWCSELEINDKLGEI